MVRTGHLAPVVGTLVIAAALLALTVSSPGLRIEGLDRTRPAVVEREFGRDGLTDSAAFERGLANLRNLGIFSKVEGTWSDSQPVVQLREKWTTIPIAKFKSGGGVSAFTIGVFDPNVAGQFLELGGQYENRSGTHSGVTWFREPRLANRRILLGADFWYTNRVREEFLGDASRGFAGDRRIRLHAFLEPEIHRLVRLHAGVEWLDDTLSSELLELSDDQPAVKRPSLASQSWVSSVGATLGRIDQDIEIQQGATVEGRWDVSWAGERWNRRFVEAKAFWLAAPRLNLAGRAFWGSGSARTEFHDWRLGGLEQVRGLPEDFLVGDAAWYANLELRGTAWKSDWLRVQTVAFTDLGGLTGFDTHNSWGAGVRLLSPKIYRLNLRLDWAQGHQSGISAGLQQFF